MNNGRSSPWINDGEKYSMVGLSVNAEGPIHSEKITPNLWLLADTTFNMPSHWRDWLGTLRADQIEHCNLFLLSKQVSTTPDVPNDEDENLKQHAWSFYVGLLLSSTVAPNHRPVLLTGARCGEKIDISQQQHIKLPVRRIFDKPVLPDDLRMAAQLGENLAALVRPRLQGKYLRLSRILDIYIEARTKQAAVDRVHQYTRCIDGLILPDIGKTKQQFRSRTELFIGPYHHQIIGEIYDVRSNIEHLNDDRYLETFDRELRLDLLKKEMIIENIARTALARIIGNNTLWPYFESTAALAGFWKQPSATRQAIWGNPIDPMAAINDFHPEHIDNILLDP